MSDRRVALVANASFYVGPALARLLATRGHDLVVGDAPPELVEELAAAGAAVEVVEGVTDLSDPAASEKLVSAALDRFGRIDSAAAATGRVVVGRGGGRPQRRPGERRRHQLHGLHRRLEHVHDRPVRGVRRRLGMTERHERRLLPQR